MLDPFGKKALEYLNSVGIESLSELLSIIPARIDVNTALERVSWINTQNYPPNDIINLDRTKSELHDIMTFYALLGALVVSPYGLEMELVKLANMVIYKARFEQRIRETRREILPSKQTEKLNSLVSQLFIEVKAVRENEINQRDKAILEKTLWRDELDVEDRENKELKFKIHLSDFFKFVGDDLKKYYIKGGYVYIQKGMLVNAWQRSFELNIERAVNKIYENRDTFFQNYYSELYTRLSEIARRYFKKRLEGVGRTSAQPLRFDLFPPCVKIALGGVPSGLRNYAITVLLTSFLSYARICPNPPSKNVRIKDCIKDLSIIEKEILPVIIEAGNRCSPPLFEDQPNEIKNIWYHLGFGYTSKPKLEDSGTSTWYFPPNCSKIKANAPQLCKPDKDCKYIKNPLTYYLRKLYLESKK